MTPARKEPPAGSGMHDNIRQRTRGSLYGVAYLQEALEKVRSKYKLPVKGSKEAPCPKGRRCRLWGRRIVSRGEKPGVHRLGGWL